MWEIIKNGLKKLFNNQAYWIMILIISILGVLLNMNNSILGLTVISILGLILSLIGTMCSIIYLIFFINWKKKEVK